MREIYLKSNDNGELRFEYMRDDLLISVIIPLYNCQEYIKETLESLINQKYKGFEIIIINDGSIDNSLNVSQGILSQSNIKYQIINKKNEGVSKSRNLGIELAKGKYIYFLDSDDLITSDLFENLIDKLKQHDLDMVFWGFMKVKDNKITWSYDKKALINKKIYSGRDLVLEFLRFNIFICIGSAIYKKQLLIDNNIFFNEESSNGEDQEFIIKSLFHSRNVMFIEDMFFKYVERPESITNSISLKRLDVLKSFNNLYKYLVENKASSKILNELLKVKLPDDIIYNICEILKRIEREKITDYINNKEFMDNINSNEIKQVLRRVAITKLSLRNIKVFIKSRIYLISPCKFIKIYNRFKSCV